MVRQEQGLLALSPFDHTSSPLGAYELLIPLLFVTSHSVNEDDSLHVLVLVRSRSVEEEV